MFQSDMVKSHASRLAQEYSLKLDFFLRPKDMEKIQKVIFFMKKIQKSTTC